MAFTLHKLRARRPSHPRRAVGERGRGTAGFSFTEILAVLVILALVGTAVVNGIPAANSAYIAATDAANAQVLLSTTSTRLRDVLAVAKTGDASSITSGASASSAGYLVEFDSYETGRTLRLANGSDGITVTSYKPRLPDDADVASNETEELLVAKDMTNAARADSILCTKADSIDYLNGVFTVKNLRVCRGSDDDAPVSAQVDELKVRALGA